MPRDIMVDGYLGLTSLGFGALSVRSGLSQLCEFGSLCLNLCSPLVGHGAIWWCASVATVENLD